ncbi:hypothetical protein N008_08805 [Hymenobacter sp. APR13]|nr:hypothetical protein N008_08805 [Hymenobacter sp. APR13]
MRIVSLKVVAAAALLLGSLTGCDSKPATEAGAATPAASVAAPADSLVAPAAAAAYICPMKCEGSASDKPGKCPVCEMALEPAEASKPAG